MAQTEKFGTLPDGRDVTRAAIGDDAIAAHFLNWGARIQDLRVRTSSGWRSVALGFPTLAGYLAPKGYYCGAVAGRCANRIAHGHFVLDGKSYELPLNEKGNTHLHGGMIGFSGRIWRLAEHTETAAAYGLTSPDGEEGYPGTVEATCRYEITAPGELTLHFEAATDSPTIVNLASHPFFDLDGTGDIRDHLLRIPAEARTPADAGLIPTGEIAEVGGTAWDFRDSRPMRGPVTYDDNFLIAMTPVAEPRLVASVVGPASGIRLDVLSTEPGLQFYDGSGMDVPEPGHDGRLYGAFAGFALEPQRFPDSINHPNFTNVVLRPGELYRQRTIFRFSGM